MKKGIKYDFTLLQILLVPTCVALSVVGYQITQMLKLPLYFDIAGLSIAAILGGPWIAAITAVLNHIVNGMIYPTALPFMPVSIGIGIFVGFASDKGMLKGPIRTALVILGMSLLGSLISAPIVVYLFGGVTGSTTDVLTAVFLQSGQEFINAVLNQTFIIGLINNTINLLFAMYIVRKISPRYLSKTNYGSKFIRKNKKEYTIDGEVK